MEFLIEYLLPVLTTITITSIIMVTIEFIRRSKEKTESIFISDKLKTLDIKSNVLFEIKSDISNEIMPKINSIYDSYNNSYQEITIDALLKSLSKIGVSNYQKIDNNRAYFGLFVNEKNKISFSIEFHQKLNAIRILSFSIDIPINESNEVNQYLLSENSKLVFAKIGFLENDSRKLIVVDHSIPYFEGKADLKCVDVIVSILINTNIRIIDKLASLNVKFNEIDLNEYSRRMRNIMHRN